MPPYFKQQGKHTCSLAVLRSVLAVHHIEVSEDELVSKVEKDYGKSFKNLWNPTIAKLAREFGIDTHMYAEWPLFKPDLLEQAMKEYSQNPETIDINKYENPEDDSEFEESLALAYSEMFEAIRLGCQVTYGSLTEKRLRSLLGNNNLVQTSIRNSILYPKGHDNYHSLLIYEIDGQTVSYHDPAREGSMTCDVELLLKAANNTGAFMSFKK